MPFFAFQPAISKMIYTTNAVESLNRNLRKVIKTRGSFPSDEAALKLLYTTIHTPIPAIKASKPLGKDRTRP